MRRRVAAGRKPFRHYGTDHAGQVAEADIANANANEGFLRAQSCDICNFETTARNAESPAGFDRAGLFVDASV